MTSAHPVHLLYRRMGPDFRAVPNRAVPNTEPRDVYAVRNLVVSLNKVYKSEEYKNLLAALDLRNGALLADLKNVGWTTHSFTAKAQWRVAAGLAYGRLDGVGFHLHPLYGFPYLPASSLKGALVHFGEDFGISVPGAFGTLDQAAKVVLFDAFPKPGQGNLLAEDILNKHHPNYYQAATGAVIQPPADYDQPSPVKFISMARNIRLSLNLAIRPDSDASLARIVEKLIRPCLLHGGVGAKTAKGYGRLDIS